MTDKFEEKPEFITLSNFDLKRENIKEIYNIDKLIEVIPEILTSDIIGFDSEFISSHIPCQFPEMFILQLATRNQCFVINVKILKKKTVLIDFCREILESKNILKIGFSANDDLIYLKKSLGIENLKCNNLIDLFEIIKLKKKKEINLKNVCSLFFEKKMDKSEQFSNWGQIPLREAQIIYAALDAMCLVRVFEILSLEKEFEYQDFVKNYLIN